MYSEPPRVAMNFQSERKTNMKKFIAMMLCIILTLSLVACGGNTEEPTESTTESVVETEATEEATEEITEELTEEEFVNDEEYVEPAYDEIRFIHRAEDWTETEIEPNETMLLLASLYEGYPADQRPGFLCIRELAAEEMEMNYLPTDMEGLVVTVCEPGMTLAHFTSIITVPEGTDPQTVVDYINTNIDPELRSKWFSHAAETYELVVSGNQILFIMCDTAFAEHCVNAFNAKMAG